ncbi:MAG: hypothetical protein QXR58_02475 [Candidatus Micrarchaeaceae archaeon]
MKFINADVADYKARGDSTELLHNALLDTSYYRQMCMAGEGALCSEDWGQTLDCREDTPA